ncbi:MAG: hypothetical protein UY76_C0008G0013 [Candidatus Uhrbacteria bacterium GW2011_GWA2_52_8d]|uniref:Uncharacterized protein n=1 Tax=Candidatus Uhrbacteria bacterium GW2011_GWA2_52_8d TaxID=1618979 RepID=A0A0G1XQK9_9BACT|nr:MAG: hypothetical protein UY76_C0008G0013 [Candidatus Uhrbacteria bacterium GW2011_GWA2_52_8d]
MFVGLLVIAVGWFITIRGFLDEVPNIKTAIEQGVSQAADEIQEAQLEPPVEVREITKALEDVKAGYEAEKQKQQISPEEESSYE